MKKKVTAWVLTGTLACTLALPAMAAEATPVPISAPISTESTAALPDSVLYYGTVKEVIQGEDGSIAQIRMDSDRYGAYVMNIGEQTVWIDSGRHTAYDPADLKVGEGVYVFHSPVETNSLPPQSPAFAVVCNIPMDTGCAQYHEVEKVAMEDGQLHITTDNGGLLILADGETKLSAYGADDNIALKDIKAGSYVMAWYESYAAVYPGQTYANHLMLLPAKNTPEESSDVLTRGELARMLYEQEGKPAVNFAMDYTDVEDGTPYTEAIRWATSEGLMAGYGNGAFGPDDAVSREQLVTILWRYEGSPTLMDYPGLTKFSDAGEIAPFAQPAFAWAHQKGYIAPAEGNVLDPQGSASRELAESMLDLAVAHR